jgi:hypothetical protein
LRQDKGDPVARDLDAAHRARAMILVLARPLEGRVVGSEGGGEAQDPLDGVLDVARFDGPRDGRREADVVAKTKGPAPAIGLDLGHGHGEIGLEHVALRFLGLAVPKERAVHAGQDAGRVPTARTRGIERVGIALPDDPQRSAPARAASCGHRVEVRPRGAGGGEEREEEQCGPHGPACSTGTPCALASRRGKSPFRLSRALAFIVLPLLACNSVFGSGESEVVVQVAGAAPRPGERSVSPGEEFEQDAERVRALLVLGDARAADQHCHGALGLEGGAAHERAILAYRCARAAQALGDELRARQLFARASQLEPGARPLESRPAVVLGAPVLGAIRAKLQAMGVAAARDFEVVDGPVAVGAHRVVTLERCVEPSDSCEAALVTLMPDNTPVDAVRVPYGSYPGSLVVMPLSDPRAHVVIWKADVRADLRIGLFLAARLDGGRITPVALVYSTDQDPARAAKVQMRQDALVIDETEAPWDVRLRGFRGAPVASAEGPAMERNR